ncbi:unnamed protein product [Miscanthus lutarioriparius]|uniref:PGG domain-containing protein n=1 Tax=Miscanthus lutarioriparius TaxID=422564 RepID=A0A811QFU3_9POAL|nr:unnamed protein product [Miscanthus lutarioriparius]
MDPQQQSIQLAAGASPAGSPAKATPPPMQQPPQCDHERMVVGNMCPSLYLAVYKGRMAEVTALLLQQHAAAIDCQATGVVMHGQCDILELTAERNTALHVAAEQGHHELIRELYLRFRDQGLLSRQNSALDTPMHCAARAGHARAVAVLVELARDRGENILGCKNEAGDTALHLASRHGHGAAVEVLVSAAAQPAAELNNAGVSPLYLAVISGSVSAVRAIITKCKDASSMGPSAQNALHAAVFQSSEMVHLLLEWRPALADQVDCSGSSPLHFASSDGDRSIVRAILRAGPPGTVYKKDSSGLSALHVAARMGHHRVVKNMLRSCPDAAELRDGNGGTFVHAAAREKRSSVVSLATKDPMLRGLLDAQDREGNTPLHLAVAAGSTGIVEDLLRNGKVRANVPNNDGHTAFDLAAGSTTSFFKMVSLVVALVAYGAQLRPQRQDQLEQWVGRDKVQKGIQNTSDSLAVVAGLIIAAAFAAGFNLPGGYGNDGKANLKDEAVFKSFLLLNTGAVVTSIVVVILLVYGKASRSWKSFAVALQLLWVSLVCMMLAFQAALLSVATTRALSYGFVCVYTCILVLQLCIAQWLGHATRLPTIWRFHWKGRRHVDVKRQYPFAKATVLNLQLFGATSFLVSIGFEVIFILSRISQRSKDTSIAPSPSALYY